jgi:ABC-type amino acid transport system permease subunit
MNNDETEIAVEYFRALRSEIDLRIKNHGYLTISKIVACSALLGHLVSSQSGTPALISIPVLAFGLDLVIYHNINRVNAIGKYIKAELEAKVFKTVVTKGWTLCEQKFQTDTQGTLDLIFDRFGQLLITALFAVLAFVLASPPQTDIFRSGLLWLVVCLLLADAAAALASTASDG